MSKSLDPKIFKFNDFGTRELACANRYGLDHDCASDGLCARSDVTMGLWKFPGSWANPAILQPARLEGGGEMWEVGVVDDFSPPVVGIECASICAAVAVQGRSFFGNQSEKYGKR